MHHILMLFNPSSQVKVASGPEKKEQLDLPGKVTDGCGGRIEASGLEMVVSINRGHQQGPQDFISCFFGSFQKGPMSLEPLDRKAR